MDWNGLRWIIMEWYGQIFKQGQLSMDWYGFVGKVYICLYYYRLENIGLGLDGWEWIEMYWYRLGWIGMRLNRSELNSIFWDWDLLV